MSVRYSYGEIVKDIVMRTVGIVAAIISVLLFIVFVSSIVDRSGNDPTITQEQSRPVEMFQIPAPTSILNQHITSGDQPRYGFSRGPGIQIDWRGIDFEEGANPVDVLQATANRMQHLQSTAAGSDANARALFSVLEAIDQLSGTSEVTAPIPSPPGATK